MNHCCWGWCKRKEERRACAKPSAKWLIISYYGSSEKGSAYICIQVLQEARIRRFWNLHNGTMGSVVDKIESNLYFQIQSSWISLNMSSSPRITTSDLGVLDVNPDFFATSSNCWQFSKGIYCKSWLKPLSSCLGLTVHVKNKSKTDRSTTFLGYKF